MVGAAEGQAKEEDSGERGKQKVHINARLHNIIHCSYIRILMIIHMYNITCLNACACMCVHACSRIGSGIQLR